MENELIKAFSNEPKVMKQELRSLNIGYNRRTGEKFAKATTTDGRSYIKTLSKTGVREDKVIEIPPYSTREERNKIIGDLSEKYTQSDIADMLDISQGTVSNTLKKR